MSEAFDLDAVQRMWNGPVVGDTAAHWFCIPCQEWIKPGDGERHWKPNGVSCDLPHDDVSEATSLQWQKLYAGLRAHLCGRGCCWVQSERERLTGDTALCPGGYDPREPA